MTPSHAAYGLFCRLKAHKNWLSYAPDAAECVLIVELIRCGWIVREKLREPVAAKETNPKHKLLIEAWCLAWAEHFQIKYAFSPRDARAAGQLLKEGLEPHEVIELAERAWAAATNQKQNAWACCQGVTLHGFAAQLNKIRVELGNRSSGEQLKARVL